MSFLVSTNMELQHLSPLESYIELAKRTPVPPVLKKQSRSHPVNDKSRDSFKRRINYLDDIYSMVLSSLKDSALSQSKSNVIPNIENPGAKKRRLITEEQWVPYDYQPTAEEMKLFNKDNHTTTGSLISSDSFQRITRDADILSSAWILKSSPVMSHSQRAKNYSSDNLASCSNTCEIASDTSTSNEETEGPTSIAPLGSQTDSQAPSVATGTTGTTVKRSIILRNTKHSEYCHVCRRTTKVQPLMICSRMKQNKCRKVACQKCFEKYNWDWEDTKDLVKSKQGNYQFPVTHAKSWICSHCEGSCPDVAQCKTYKQINAKRKLKKGETSVIETRH